MDATGIVITMKDGEKKEDDDMLPEYDLSKLKLVGRGIYAERYRAGVKFFILCDSNLVEEDVKAEKGTERRRRSIK